MHLNRSVKLVHDGLSHDAEVPILKQYALVCQFLNQVSNRKISQHCWKKTKIVRSTQLNVPCKDMNSSVKKTSPFAITAITSSTGLQHGWPKRVYITHDQASHCPSNAYFLVPCTEETHVTQPVKSRAPERRRWTTIWAVPGWIERRLTECRVSLAIARWHVMAAIRAPGTTYQFLGLGASASPLR